MNHASTQPTTRGASAQATTQGASAQAVAGLTLFLGLALVFTVGFAHSSTLHNAGHDTRHAMAFPCH
ncbi:MAG: CbtB-domain containing protein [Pseudomonadota bacterium]|nr:CbtB-domain containing protein [Pseudomonadota bacterium]